MLNYQSREQEEATASHLLIRSVGFIALSF